MKLLQNTAFIALMAFVSFLILTSGACPDGEVMCLVTAAEFGGH